MQKTARSALRNAQAGQELAQLAKVRGASPMVGNADSAWFAIGERDRAALADAIEAAGIPAGPINSIDQVFADPQVLDRGLQIEVDGMAGVASPIVIDGKRQTADRGSPSLGRGSGFA